MEHLVGDAPSARYEGVPEAIGSDGMDYSVMRRKALEYAIDPGYVNPNDEYEPSSNVQNGHRLSRTDYGGYNMEYLRAVLTHLLTYSPTHSSTHSLTQSLTNLFTRLQDLLCYSSP